MDNIILLALALAPVFALGSLIFWKDKWEKEPLRRLLFTFIAGMLSCIPIIIIELSTDWIFAPRDGSIKGAFLTAFIFVGLTEELGKWAAVMLFAYKKNDFNEPYDGIIYAVMASLGFAAIENILYIYEGGMSVGIIRAFTAVPAHTIMGVLMGYFMGLAKFKPQKKKIYLLLSIIAPVLLHGSYNFSLYIPNETIAWSGALLSLGIGIFLARRAMKIHAHSSPFNTQKHK